MTESDIKPVAPIAPSQPAISVEALASLEAENLIDVYQVIAEWIRFADAKAAVILTVGGGLAGLLIPTLKEYLHSEKLTHPFSWWTAAVVILYMLWVGMLVLSSIWAFRCILPFRRRGRHPALGRCQHFHPAAIQCAYTLDEVDRFIKDCSELGMASLKNEITAGILIDSHVSAAKYHRVTTSIRLMGLSALCALFYLLAIQF
ncbi:MAG TPA: hypothetical protein VFG20_17565 [Planctomycetaceae bacterium]|jgi:hypothetical protein|nr:hypothetical protein [Planctomycetaceae bacterium]